jgi:hypothetical protein
MNATKISKLITRYQSGILSEAEVANSLLYDVVSEKEIDKSFIPSVALLPEKVVHEIFRLLNEIRDSDFHWTPFLLTSDVSRRNSTEYTQKLRQLYGMLVDKV